MKKNGTKKKKRVGLIVVFPSVGIKDMFKCLNGQVVLFCFWTPFSFVIPYLQRCHDPWIQSEIF